MRRLIVSLVLFSTSAFGSALGVPAASTAPQNLQATSVFLGGRILSLTDKFSLSTAVAVDQDRILEVGSDAQIRKWIGPDTAITDLKGKTVIPGLIDAHVHLYQTGKAKNELDLSAAKDEDDAIAKVAFALATTPKGRWVVGHGWDQNRWPSKTFPTITALDKISPDHPVVLERIDGHAVWVNSQALKLAGIGLDSKDPVGGKILRDKDGQATGILTDRAMSPVYKQIPEPSKADVEAALKTALKDAAAFGLTSVHDMSVGRDEIEALENLAKTGQLPIRVSVFISRTDPSLVQEWLKAGPEISAYDRHLTIRGFKLFADGALGSRGAAMLEPYDDDHENTGNLMLNKTEIVEFSKKALRAGFQVATHAIGDRANRLVLDAYEEAFREYPTVTPPRFRIEHAQILQSRDIPRFHKLGVIPSMQATHCTSDMAWVPARIGLARAQAGAYSWKALLKTGAKIANGSDSPVESMNPFPGLYAAVTRQDLQGHPAGGWIPKNKLSLKEAMKSFTLDAAYASFDENEKGTLETGKLADFTVLDEKIDEIPSAQIFNIHPVMTVVGGKVVYSR